MFNFLKRRSKSSETSLDEILMSRRVEVYKNGLCVMDLSLSTLLSLMDCEHAEVLHIGVDIEGKIIVAYG